MLHCSLCQSPLAVRRKKLLRLKPPLLKPPLLLLLKLLLPPLKPLPLLLKPLPKLLLPPLLKLPLLLKLPSKFGTNHQKKSPAEPGLFICFFTFFPKSR